MSTPKSTAMTDTGDEEGVEPMKTTPERIVLVAQEHVRRFENLISIGSDETQSRSHNIRVGECRQYLAIWQSIVRKGGKLSDLTLSEKGEVEDAYYDGSYDHIFKETGSG